ncbi:MAG: protein kinase [Planctomycetota bacterium]
MSDDTQPNTPENTDPHPGMPGGADDETVRDAPSSRPSGSSMGSTPAPSSKVAVPPPLPEVLDKYRILGEIGRGGMGSVYAAVRDDDAFKKRVAVKVMRLGLDTEDMLARFELERQVLGAINHPNIARVFDAGSTPDGRPYFVMELVEGKPIDRYCDDENLSVPGRLELFRKVCGAVHVAHQNLVVHRDIKPANILVNTEGEPKLLDFGIAKLLNPEMAAIDPMTRADQRLLTYEYASPEQVTGERITTASDVYALGVLLYELLTGHRPYQLTKRVYEEAVRVICSTEPQRPSTAVSQAVTTRGPGDSVRTVSGEEIARRREMQLARLKKRLSGDLDNIVLKAMRKTPSHRYVSAEDLAADIERHLGGQTVNARPPTWDYRASKFIKRHKGAVVAGIAIVMSILAGTAATTSQWLRADAERADAEARYEHLRELTLAFDDIEADIAQLEGATAARRVIADSLIQTLDAIRPAAEGDTQLLLDLASGYRRAGAIAVGEEGLIGNADESLKRAEEILGSIPETQGGRAAESARLDFELAQTFELKGDHTESISRFRAAADGAIGTASSQSDPITMRVMAVEALGRLALARASRGDFTIAEEASSEAIDLALGIRERTPNDERASGAVALAYKSAGRVAERQGQFETAVSAYTKAINARDGLFEAQPNNGDNLRRLMLLLEVRSRIHRATSDFDAAVADAERAKSLADRRIEQDPFSGRAFEDAARSYENLGDTWFGAGDSDQALTAYREFLARSTQASTLDPANTQKRRMVALAHKKSADVQRRRQGSASAIDAYREALATYIPLLEVDPENLHYRYDELWIAYYLARALEGEGESAAAARLFERGIAAGELLVERAWSEPGVMPFTGECLRGRARVHLLDGQGEPAVELFARAQERRPSTYWSTLRDEARAFEVTGNAEAEADRLTRLTQVIEQLDEVTEEIAAAKSAAEIRLGELTGAP